MSEAKAAITLGISAMLWLAACGGERATAESVSPVTPAPAVRLLGPSWPVLASDGQRHLLHELIIENAGADALQLEQLDVLAPGRPEPLVAHAGAALEALLLPAGGGRLEAGALGAVFLDVVLPATAPLPERLTHRVLATSPRGERLVLEAEAELESAPPLSLAPPLRGAGLLAANGCCDGPHRRALFALPEGLFLAQRHAIDFIQLEADSNASGDPGANESYFIHGDEVLAPASGSIVSLRDGVADNTPGALPAPGEPEALPGNFIVQQLDGGAYALFAHLAAGSFRVSPGQRVERGQVLAHVGNSGNSSEPHLHFQVMNAASPLLAQGLPFVFDAFRLERRLDLSASPPAFVPAPAPAERAQQLPMNGDVIAFE